MLQYLGTKICSYRQLRFSQQIPIFYGLNIIKHKYCQLFLVFLAMKILSSGTLCHVIWQKVIKRGGRTCCFHPQEGEPYILKEEAADSVTLYQTARLCIAEDSSHHIDHRGNTHFSFILYRFTYLRT
jgi:hypothetical protein